jgi:hypothetical protein
MTNPTNPFNWQMPTASDLVTDLPADFETFGQAVATSMADLLGGTTGQVLSKASNTDMDFTWVTSDDANAIQNAIVDAKGDLIAASAADTPARLAVGNNGETLVADSSTSTGLRYQQVQNVNACYNSAFDIWQRGTSFAATGATNQYAADRWLIYRGVGSSTFSRQAAGSLGTTPAQIAQYCMRVARDSGNTATNEIYLMQTFENVDSNAYLGKTVVFSFYARKGANFSEANSYVTGAIVTGTGTDQNQLNFTGFSALQNTNFTLTTSWQRFQMTATVPTNVTQIGVRFFYAPTGTAGAADYFEVTAVKFETGSIASTFNRQNATIQGELAACRRYYQKFGGNNTYEFIGQGFAGTTTLLSVPIQLDTPMRVVPTSVDFSTLCWWIGGAVTAISAATLQSNSNSTFKPVIAMTTTGVTANSTYGILTNNSTSGYIALNAEL